MQHAWRPTIDEQALGVTLFVMLVGHHPFDGDDEHQLFENISKHKIRTHCVEWKALSKPAQHFLLRLMQAQADKRPTADEALRDSWITGGGGGGTSAAKALPKISRDFAEALQLFGGLPRLQQMALVVAAHRFDRDDIADIVVAFDRVDVTRSGPY